MSPANPARKRCAQCDTAIVEGQLQGLCPRCLAESAFADPAGDLPKLDTPSQEGDMATLAHGFSRYELLEKVGKGGMGEVYLARDRQLERRVALKLLPAGLATRVPYRNRFLREAKAASALNHPNLCTIHEIGAAPDNQLYIAMELVEGETLASKLRRAPPTIEAVVAVATQIAGALDAAHAQGIVHRDIKPANICSVDENQVKVLDFGLAKRVAREMEEESSPITETVSGQVVGTPQYMSPEQVRGREVDHRSDFFSLGTVLYELVTGRPAFTGGSFVEIAEQVIHEQPEAIARFNYNTPIELERIIRKLLEKDPARRYQSARELIIDLRSLLETLQRQGQAAPTLEQEDSAASSALIQSGCAVEESVTAASLKDSDVYISYAPLDDAPLPQKREGWISKFHRNLEVRAAQLYGEPVKVRRRPGSCQAEPSPDAMNALRDVKTLVSVLSPSFMKTSGCRREVAEFCKQAQENGALFIQERPRIFNALKSPIEADPVPEDLCQLFLHSSGFEFFDRDPATGRIREFDEAFGEEARQRFYEKIYDLAYDVCQALKCYDGKASPAPTARRLPKRKTIFLAVTTSDLQPQRDRLRRELNEQGHTVVPDQPLPWNVVELEKTVRHWLHQCHLAIHMIGDRYGVVPEDSDESVTVLLNQFAAKQSAQTGLERLIWIPRGIQPRDVRQEKFLRELMENPETHRGAEVVQDTLENLKEILADRERRSKENTSGGRCQTRKPRSARVYLICAPNDENAVEPLEDALFQAGIEVTLPAFDADETQFQRFHFQSLQDCDAALIYYASASKWWVDVKVRDLIKAAGYRNAQPIAVQAVYVAPPFDRRKERFQTVSAKVIRQQSETIDPSLLNEFIQQTKAALID